MMEHYDLGIVCADADHADATQLSDMIKRVVTFEDGTHPKIWTVGCPALFHTHNKIHQLNLITNCAHYIFIWATKNMSCSVVAEHFMEEVLLSKIYLCEDRSKIVTVYQNKEDITTGYRSLHDIDLSRNNQSMSETNEENIDPLILKRIRDRMLEAYDKRPVKERSRYTSSEQCIPVSGELSK